MLCKFIVCVFFTDIETVLCFAKTYYMCQKYEECVRQCDRLSNNDEAKILKAKSLYHIYTHEEVFVKKASDHITKQALQQKIEHCYSKARQVIGILGKALDENLPGFDEECSEMLDLTMINYMHATNKLRDANRCLLCRKYQGTSASQRQAEKSNTIENPDESSDAKQQTTKKPKLKQKPGLLASHLFPESILKQFSLAVPLAKGKRVCAVSGAKTSHTESLQSAGEITLYMLCHKCEEILSVSESWFLQSFFKKIYNPAHPDSAKSNQSLKYNHHLYKFCLGLVFRLLHYSSIQILNSADVYALLQQCRDCLLKEDSTVHPAINPEVYLLMSPFSEEVGKELGSINQVLTATLTNLFGFHPLQADLDAVNDYPCIGKLHFFLVHIGVLNIVIKLKPSHAYQIDSKFQISEEGGIYSVPSDRIRKSIIPPGIYALFQMLAMEREKLFLEGPHLTYNPLKDPDSKAAKTFGILDAEYQDEAHISLIEDVNAASKHNRYLCFLPVGFSVNPISVPENHSILLHHTHGNQDSGVIIFISVGFNESEGYGIEKPYVICYVYKPGFIFGSGFFVCPDTLTPLGCLPNSRGIGNVNNPEKYMQFHRYCDIVKCTLREKGFYSLKSLMYRLQNMSRFVSIWHAVHLLLYCIGMYTHNHRLINLRTILFLESTQATENTLNNHSLQIKHFSVLTYGLNYYTVVTIICI